MRYTVDHYAYAYERKGDKVIEKTEKIPKGYKGVVETLHSLDFNYYSIVITKEGTATINIGEKNTFQAMSAIRGKGIVWSYGTIDGRTHISYDKTSKKLIEALKSFNKKDSEYYYLREMDNESKIYIVTLGSIPLCSTDNKPRAILLKNKLKNLYESPEISKVIEIDRGRVTKINVAGMQAIKVSKIQLNKVGIYTKECDEIIPFGWVNLNGIKVSL